MILLDTHALVWWFDGNPRLGPSSRERMVAELDAQAAVISPITLWEIAMLVRKQRLVLAMPVETWIGYAIDQGGIRLISVTPEIAMRAGGLPDDVHGDPCDRILIASARALDCPLLTADGLILDHAAAGLLTIVDATT